MRIAEDLHLYFDEIPLWSAPFGLTLLEHINYGTGMKVLDIGFGTGFPAIEIAGRLGKSSTVYGIDLWEGGIERARQKAEYMKVKNLKLKYASAEEIPFKHNFFDLIVSNNGINNVDDLEKTLEECFRVLKKTGQFVFTFNLPETMIEFYDEFEKVLNKFSLFEGIKKMKEHIFKMRKTPDYMKKKLTKAGFKNIKVYNNIFHYNFPDAESMLNYYPIREFFKPSWETIIPKNLITKIFKEVKTNLDKEFKNKNSITLSVPFVCVDCRK